MEAVNQDLVAPTSCASRVQGSYQGSVLAGQLVIFARSQNGRASSSNAALSIRRPWKRARAQSGHQSLINRQSRCFGKPRQTPCRVRVLFFSIAAVSRRILSSASAQPMSTH